MFLSIARANLLRAAKASPFGGFNKSGGVPGIETKRSTLESTVGIESKSPQVYEGETFGLVGESGSGKTTIGRAILKLYDNFITGGEILVLVDLKAKF